MIRQRFLLKDFMGLHARPALQLMAGLQPFHVSVEVLCSGRRGNGKDALSLMAMNSTAGEEVLFLIHGPEEEQAALVVKSVMAQSGELLEEDRQGK